MAYLDDLKRRMTVLITLVPEKGTIPYNDLLEALRQTGMSDAEARVTVMTGAINHIVKTDYAQKTTEFKIGWRATYDKTMEATI